MTEHIKPMTDHFSAWSDKCELVKKYYNPHCYPPLPYPTHTLTPIPYPPYLTPHTYPTPTHTLPPHIPYPPIPYPPYPTPQIPEYCSSLDEGDVQEHVFELIFAFDEIVALGYRESVNLAQIRTFTEMDSHEEKVFEAMRRVSDHHQLYSIAGGFHWCKYYFRMN